MQSPTGLRAPCGWRPAAPRRARRANFPSPTWLPRLDQKPFSQHPLPAQISSLRPHRLAPRGFTCPVRPTRPGRRLCSSSQEGLWPSLLPASQVSKRTPGLQTLLGLRGTHEGEWESPEPCPAPGEEWEPLPRRRLPSSGRPRPTCHFTETAEVPGHNLLPLPATVLPPGPLSPGVPPPWSPLGSSPHWCTDLQHRPPS